jgi:NMD protein affecting ribosome stability and mRNA decay
VSNPSVTRTHEHRHEAVAKHALRQERGIPYEVERVVCTACKRVLSERTLRRAAA